jgi:hypothetical protein
MKALVPPLICGTCRSRQHYPKYSCKTCLYSFTSNFKKAREFDHAYLRRKERRERLDESVPQLRTLYSRIKEKYFGGNYVPHPGLVSFEWKRGDLSGGGWCLKRKKLIKIGKWYRLVFAGKFLDRRKSLVDLMIHEMIHLRLPHHRKSFKQKEKEIAELVRNEHMTELYDGLIRYDSMVAAQSNQGVVAVPQENK